MTAPFVTSLRTPNAPIVLGRPSDRTLHLRAQVLEAWDAVRIDANPAEPVKSLKLRALAALYPHSGDPAEFVVKLRGIEILDENVSLADAGAIEGSTFLIADRRRRPVQ
jgi:hypothetical protein